MRTAPGPLRALSLLAPLALLAAGIHAPPAAAQEPPAAPRRPGKVVVFGIDGADAEVFEGLRAGGRLPHFDALARRGSYARLGTTNPAQSPVAWAAFSTGSNPGKTGIYDFLRRDPEVPGKLEISLASRTWVDGPVGGAARFFLPVGLGAGLGLLAYGLVLLLLRPFRAVPDRARRISGTAAGLLAALALGAFTHRLLGWIPERVPKAVSNRMGVPLWVALGQAGVKSVAIEAPVSFPADRAANLQLLTGLGTPDVQGHWGFYSVYTEDPREIVIPETGGFVDCLAFGAGGAAYTRVYGPPDLSLSADENAAIERQAALARSVWEMKPGVPSAKRFEERVFRHAERAGQASCILEVVRDAAARTVTVRTGSGGPRPILDLPLPAAGPAPAAALPAPGDPSVRWGAPVTLKEGEWSDYVPFEFVMNPVVSVKGIGKFWLEEAGGPGRPMRLLLTPVSFDPREIPEIVEISWPREFAPSLAAQAGLYNLVGWPCLTNPVKDQMLSDEAFLQQVRGLTRERRAKLRAGLDRLARGEGRFLFVMFSEVDRIQHAFWRHVDARSPLHDAAAAARYAPAVEEFYVAMDGVLGEIVEGAGEDAAVLVVSDHGFSPFRRGVNINTWLLREGFQVNREGVGGTGPDRDVNELFTGGGFFERIDWARTRAYAVGLGEIYLNLKGREKAGSVLPERADEVCAEIRRRLLDLRDADGARVVREVYLGRDIYSGPTALRYAPDLVVGFERGYRVSWQTTLGGGGQEVVEDNRFPWSGDHCSVDPSLVPGILVSSEPLREGAPNIIDVAPTVLDLFGIPVPADWDGKSLLRR